MLTRLSSLLFNTLFLSVPTHHPGVHVLLNVDWIAINWQAPNSIALLCCHLHSNIWKLFPLIYFLSLTFCLNDAKKQNTKHTSLFKPAIKQSLAHSGKERKKKEKGKKAISHCENKLSRLLKMFVQLWVSPGKRGGQMPGWVTSSLKPAVRRVPLGLTLQILGEIHGRIPGEALHCGMVKLR